jgi:hypothetical protein
LLLCVLCASSYAEMLVTDACAAQDG